MRASASVESKILAALGLDLLTQPVGVELHGTLVHHAHGRALGAHGVDLLLAHALAGLPLKALLGGPGDEVLGALGHVVDEGDPLLAELDAAVELLEQGVGHVGQAGVELALVARGKGEHAGLLGLAADHGELLDHDGAGAQVKGAQGAGEAAAGTDDHDVGLVVVGRGRLDRGDVGGLALELVLGKGLVLGQGGAGGHAGSDGSRGSDGAGGAHERTTGHFHGSAPFPGWRAVRARHVACGPKDRPSPCGATASCAGRSP